MIYKSGLGTQIRNIYGWAPSFTLHIPPQSLTHYRWVQSQHNFAAKDFEPALKGTLINGSTFSCTKLISEQSKCGQSREGLRVYREMREEGFIPNSYTFVAVLKACSSIGNLEAGKEIHGHIVKSTHGTDIFVASTLVDMYAKCRSIADASRVFETMIYRNVVSWNSIIMGYAQMGMGKSALRLYTRMQCEGITPNARTFVAVLKACGSLVAGEEGEKLLKQECLEQGRAIHAEIIKGGFETNIFVANTLVDVYAKCGSITNARQVFEKAVHRNVVSWNAIIIAYAQLEMGDVALELYSRMKGEGVRPDDRTFVAALKACSSLAAQKEGKGIDSSLLKVNCLERGRVIHAEVAKSGYVSDIFVASTLIDMYAKCGSVVDARWVFDNMAHRNLVSWNAMITGYAQMGMTDLALDLYGLMQHEGFIPDDHSFVAALKACASFAAQEEGKGFDGRLLKTRCLQQGRAIHAEIAKSRFDSDILVTSALVDMYAKCGSMQDAHIVFENMQHHDVVSWTAMIIGYSQIERGAIALELYARMRNEGFLPDDRTFVAVLKACGSLAAQEECNELDGELLKLRCLEKGRAIHTEVANYGFESDIFVANTLIDMYAKCGSMVDAHEVFENVVYLDVVSWTAMIMGYAQMDMGESALQLFRKMQHAGFIPNSRTFTALLKACGSLVSLKTGKEIHALIHRVGLENDPFIASCIVDMYAKCGSMVDAQQFFDSLSTRDSVTWGALIAGYSGQGDSEHVFSLYKRMQQEGIKPIGITYLSVLHVCSHNCLVGEGQNYFQTMCLEDGISPCTKHYMCMVDLLGRGGQLDEAIALVKSIPFMLGIVTWKTILGASRKWNHVEIGRRAFECAVILDDKCSAAYLLMTNVYASVCMSEESAKMQKNRVNVQAWKKAGQHRWTDGAGVVDTSLLEDINHPQSKEILTKIRDLFVTIREEGSLPDLENVSHRIFDEEDMWCGHSEKLAVVGTLINTPPGDMV